MSATVSTPSGDENWQLDGYPFADRLREALIEVEDKGHGDLPKWRAALADLPPLIADATEFSPMLHAAGRITDAQSSQLEKALRVFHPWRKGPFQLFNQYIDTEWRSDWKWERVLPHLQPLKGRRVLDVGCGNGYYLWRMLGEGAEQVLGIDPMWLFRMQYRVLAHFFSPVLAPSQHVEMLPLGIDELPAETAYFDTVFSMGVLYHRREPVQHIQQLLGHLRSGGELVLETLVIPGDEDAVLDPLLGDDKGRYAQMRNVHALPTVSRLEKWLQEAGAENVRCVDVADTSTEEQRSSAWMWFHSLPQFLDAADASKTVEGHPAPRRAVVIARRT